MKASKTVAIVIGAGGGVGKAISKRLFYEGARIVEVNNVGPRLW
jgi:NAD(P)-dependent dehydrogenase (short-subunit alcohol dehydrogenase family)